VPRVLIVDPQPFFCEALACSLQSADHVEVVGWTTDEVQAEEMASAAGADLVLTELELDPGSGLSLARRLRGRTGVAILTRQHEGDVLLDAVAAGAIGCLNHATGIEGIVGAIRTAMLGRFAVDPARLHDTLRRVSAAGVGQRGRAAAGLERLTPREAEVLRLVSRGLSNAEIARVLYLSEKTVRTHVAHILRKLDVHARADAARMAVAAHEIDSGPSMLRIEGPELGRP
jgi:DNA-binding NarL/FixJ family response regulator